MSTWKEVTFFWWDWKEQPDWEDIDKALKEVNQIVRITEMDTQQDAYAIAIHPPDWEFTPQEWYTLSNWERMSQDGEAEEPENHFTPEHAKEFLKKLKEEEQASDKKVEDAYSQIVDWCASGQGSRSGAVYFKEEIKEITEKLSYSEKEQVWNTLKDHIENSEGWTIKDIKCLAELLGVKEVRVKV